MYTSNKDTLDLWIKKEHCSKNWLLIKIPQFGGLTPDIKGINLVLIYIKKKSGHGSRKKWNG